MDVSKIKKGLFELSESNKTDNQQFTTTSKSQIVNDNLIDINNREKITIVNKAQKSSNEDANIIPALQKISVTQNDESELKITYVNYGFGQASRLGGSIPGLRACLHKVFHDFKQQSRDDHAKQEELKRPLKAKVEELKIANERLENRNEKIKTDYVLKASKKIDVLRNEISDIRKNPKIVVGDETGKVSFYIGSTILIFLTIYLFIFYSSASYSAFFKQFTINEIGVASSIFDPQALTIAYEDGFTELVLLLTIPFVFLGLGYLIHKFQEQNGNIKYLKIFFLILITFLFDAILAYEITEKIYDVNRRNSFDFIPPYEVSMAVSSINFWLIIFAGFVVYIIWGFVFDFVIESHSKLDRVKVSIEEKEKQIKNIEAEIKHLEQNLEDNLNKITENNIEITKLSKALESALIPREFEQDIFSFLTGWLAWMKQIGKSADELQNADKLAHEFIDKIIIKFD